MPDRYLSRPSCRTLHRRPILLYIQSTVSVLSRSTCYGWTDDPECIWTSVTPASSGGPIDPQASNSRYTRSALTTTPIMASFTPQLATFKAPVIDNEPMVSASQLDSQDLCWTDRIIGGRVDVIEELCSRLARAKGPGRGGCSDGEGAPLRGSLRNQRKGGTSVDSSISAR